eukprot:17356-Heterococcus_DN1.PRE.2
MGAMNSTALRVYIMHARSCHHLPAAIPNMGNSGCVPKSYVTSAAAATAFPCWALLSLLLLAVNCRLPAAATATEFAIATLARAFISSCDAGAFTGLPLHSAAMFVLTSSTCFKRVSAALAAEKHSPALLSRSAPVMSLNASCCCTDLRCCSCATVSTAATASTATTAAAVVDTAVNTMVCSSATATTTSNSISSCLQLAYSADVPQCTSN